MILDDPEVVIPCCVNEGSERYRAVVCDNTDAAKLVVRYVDYGSKDGSVIDVSVDGSVNVVSVDGSVNVVSVDGSVNVVSVDGSVIVVSVAGQ